MRPEVVGITLCFLAFFAMVFGIFYMRSRENMAMIEKGLNPRNTKSTPKPFVSLKYGLLLTGAGLGMFIARMIVVTPGNGVYGHDDPAVYFALIGLGGGIGLIISYVIEKKYLLDKRIQD